VAIAAFHILLPHSSLVHGRGAVFTCLSILSPIACESIPGSPPPLSSPAVSSAPVEVSSSPTAQAQVIDVAVFNYNYEPNVIRLKQGQTVALRLTSTDGEHSLTAPDLGINIVVQQGETKEATLTADKAGTFTFGCRIPCGPRHMQMMTAGKIIVEQA
jgi:heme/copper-type cytochrome/quinol oxidase subunit 2